IGPNPSNLASDLVSPLSYPLTMGSGSNNAAAGAIMAALKAKKTAYIFADVAAAYSAIPEVDKALALNGLPAGKRVPIPVGVPDVAPYAASALADHPDVILLATVTADSDKLVQAIRQTGSKVPLIRAASTVPSTSLQTLGAFADGMYIISPYKSDAKDKG